MELSEFILSLKEEGRVAIKGKLHPFDAQDFEESKQLLRKYYDEDRIEMPFDPPVYSEKAALWASEYLYTAIQLTVLRDAGEEMIFEHLKPFDGDNDPSEIYSADLMLRYMPELFELAKGLAPADVLVQELRRTALSWPFSSVGIELEQAVNDDNIFDHPSLKYVYVDRIIKEKDKTRLKNARVVDCIHEIAGEHLQIFWPEFENS